MNLDELAERIRLTHATLYYTPARLGSFHTFDIYFGTAVFTQIIKLSNVYLHWIANIYDAIIFTSKPTKG